MNTGSLSPLARYSGEVFLELMRPGFLFYLFLSLIPLFIGCQSPQLMKTPNLYAEGDIDPFALCPPELKNDRADILYVTDRRPDGTDGGRVRYGYGRSDSVAFGSCRIGIGQGISWSDLEKASRSRHRSVRLPLRILSIRELGRFPETPYRRVRQGDRWVEDPEVSQKSRRMATRFRQELERRLESSPKKEILFFVHGYNNTFEDSVFVMANLWHFLGRCQVPIVYSWPAGRGGLRGYAYDRESGEFTIYHLKSILRLLSACSGIEKIHVVAHSRGTDVVSSAIRELLIEDRCAAGNTRGKLKIDHLVLAAPDLDLQVTRQRFGAERFSEAVGNTTLYVSERDRALRLSDWLFGSVARLGKLRLEDLTPEQREGIRNSDSLDIVDARVKTDFIGHSYFYSHPAVSSDLILLLRYDRRPGKENGRPLVPTGPNFWRLEKGYPNAHQPFRLPKMGSGIANGAPVRSRERTRSEESVSTPY